MRRSRVVRMLGERDPRAAGAVLVICGQFELRRFTNLAQARIGAETSVEGEVHFVRAQPVVPVAHTGEDQVIAADGIPAQREILKHHRRRREARDIPEQTLEVGVRVVEPRQVRLACDEGAVLQVGCSGGLGTDEEVTLARRHLA